MAKSRPTKRRTKKKTTDSVDQQILEALQGIWGYLGTINDNMPSEPSLDRIEHTLDLILAELRSQGER